ncbi:MAG: helix-turn-helix domain-containing protein [Lachnospiraceae bacterium]|nr:helix-turn-helix domain-containing protein [Lachnospiraceae bacterium]MCM1240603.1 helix-turn-helix domain-containing protein [Lachnospiraceae bacterium]
MNIADRIQRLRKGKGISQEELADQLGVSRQAISKWESEQSSPDIEKVIIMSDFFGVTTDYLLKGIEPVPNETAAIRQKPDAGLFTIVGTAFNITGVIAAAMIWYEKQTATAVAIGLILIVAGCMIYGIGMTVSEPESRTQARRKFWTVNVWILTFMPLSILYNFLTGGYRLAPYPVVGIARNALFWFVYIVIGVTEEYVIRRTGN